MKRKLTILACVLLLILAVPMTAGAYTMYVKTTNGGGVNVREEPTTDSACITKLAYGTAVEVLQNEGSWTAIDWPGWSNPAWISSRYLVYDYPGSRPQSQGGSSGSPEASSIADVNFSSFRLVDPYYVYVKASHTGGYVNLRWAPSMDAAVACRINDGSELRVIAVGKGWCQVQDERSGYVGFMRSSFLVRYADDSES